MLLNRRPDLRHARHQRAVDDVERRGAFGQLAVEIIDQAVLRAFDDVVGQPFIERKIVGLLLLPSRRAAKMLRNRGDVELIDRGLLLARLLPPVLGASQFAG